MRNRRIRDFVNDFFDISVLSQSEYLDRVAFPFCEENLNDIEYEQLWQLNRFVFQNWNNLTDDLLGVLSNRLPLKLDDGSFKINTTNNTIATPKSYSKSIIWQNIFSIQEQNEFYILSDDYMSLLTEFEKRDPLDVFDQLGANYSPNPLLVKFSYPYDSQNLKKIFNESYSCYLFNQLNNINSTSRIAGEISRAPGVLLSGKDLIIEKISILFEWLTIITLRSTRLNHWKNDSVKYYYRTSKSKYVCSELWFLLQTLKWLPTNNGFKSIGEVFLPSQQAIEIYGNALNFLNVEIPEQIINEFNLSSDISAEKVLDVLRNWSERNEIKKIDDMIKIYSRLSAQCSNLDEIFVNEALIYCPSGERNWCTSNQAIWLSQKKVLGDVFHWLDDYYPSNRQSFWIDTIGIDIRPSAEHFANAWLRLQKSDVQDPRDQIDLIYDSLLQYIRTTQPENRDSWFYDFVANAKCLSQPFTNKEGNQERSWCRADELFVSDIHERMRKSFSDAGVKFMWITRGKDHDDFDQLYDALGVKRASEYIESNASLGLHEARQSANLLLTDDTLQLICCIKKKSKKSSGEWLDDSLGLIIKSREIVVNHSIKVDS